MNFKHLNKAVELNDQYCVWGFIRECMNRFKLLNIPVIINYYCLIYFWVSERFVTVSKSELLTICDDGMSLQCIRSDPSMRRINRLAQLQATINSEILQRVSWYFEIVRSQGGPSIEFSISAGQRFTEVESDPSYHWKSGGSTFSCGSRYTGPSKNPVSFRSGDQYVVILDTKNKTISVNVNNEQPIIIFRNIHMNKVQYKLFISLRQCKEYLRIIKLTYKYY